MTFKVIYKCQNCKEVLEDSGRLTIPYKEGMSIPNILEGFVNKSIIHPCQYQVWGVATPISFKQTFEED